MTFALLGNARLMGSPGAILIDRSKLLRIFLQRRVTWPYCIPRQDRGGHELFD